MGGSPGGGLFVIGVIAMSCLVMVAAGQPWLLGLLVGPIVLAFAWRVWEYIAPRLARRRQQNRRRGPD